jgi:hypothetical protein
MKKSLCRARNCYNFSNAVCFHLNRAKNDKYNNSSENHLKSFKTSRSSYLDLKPIIFVEKFEYYLVIKGHAERPKSLCSKVRASVDGRNIFGAIYLVWQIVHTTFKKSTAPCKVHNMGLRYIKEMIGIHTIT